MNSKKSISRIELHEQLENFLADPATVTGNILKAGASFHKDEKDNADLFWQQYEVFFNQNQERFTEVHIPHLHKLREHHRFYHLKTVYEGNIEEVMKKVIDYNPSIETFTKSVFLVIELGKIHSASNLEFKLPDATGQTLNAAKKLIQDFKEAKQNTAEKEYSFELGEWVLNLVRWQTDLNNLLKIHDEFLWAGFEIEYNENEHGFIVKPDPTISKINNPYILNTLKRRIKQTYLYSISFSSLSGEQHFTKNDPVFKTNEGFVTAFHSPGLTITNQTPGTTSLEMPDSFFDSLFDQDTSRIKEEAQLMLIKQMTEVTFHYHLRIALADAYRPNDIIDIKKLTVTIDGRKFKVYELLCVAAALSAYAHRINFINRLSGFDIPSLFHKYAASKQVQEKNWSQQTTIEQFTSYVIHKYGELEEKEITSPFILKDEAYLLSLFNKVEELKYLCKEELLTLIDFFSSANNSLPFLPLYYTEKGYLIETSALSLHSYVRIVYDHFVSDELFSGTKRNPINSVRNNQREIDFNEALCQSFKKLTPFCEAAVDFTKPKKNAVAIPGVAGETDLFVYFKEENLLMPVQVKLSNTFPRKERRVYEWREGNIKGAVEQIERDVNVIESEEALAWIAKELGTTIKRKGLKVVPLIVTDNFYADRIVLPSSLKNNELICVSFFEIKNLIEETRVSPKQGDWSFLNQQKPGTYLVKLLNENYFWKFLDEEAERFTEEINISSLSAPHRMKRII